MPGSICGTWYIFYKSEHCINWMLHDCHGCFKSGVNKSKTSCFSNFVLMFPFWLGSNWLFWGNVAPKKCAGRDQALPFSVKSGWRRPGSAAHFDGERWCLAGKGYVRLSSRTRRGSSGGFVMVEVAQMYKDDSIFINKTYNKEPYEPTSPIECSTVFSQRSLTSTSCWGFAQHE